MAKKDVKNENVVVKKAGRKRLTTDDLCKPYTIDPVVTSQEHDKMKFSSKSNLTDPDAFVKEMPGREDKTLFLGGFVGKSEGYQIRAKNLNNAKALFNDKTKK